MALERHVDVWGKEMPELEPAARESRGEEVLATAVFGVVLYLIERSGWKGFVLPWLDATRYVVFFVIFFLGVLMTPKS